MSAALCALLDLVSSDVKSFKHLTASFVSILKQVVEHRLHKAYDYHRTPAPFIQVLSASSLDSPFSNYTGAVFPCMFLGSPGFQWLDPIVLGLEQRFGSGDWVLMCSSRWHASAWSLKRSGVVP